MGFNFEGALTYRLQNENFQNWKKYFYEDITQLSSEDGVICLSYTNRYIKFLDIAPDLFLP